MACGATLKRTMDFDPLMSPTSPKRRRCIPVSTSSSSPRKYLSMEPSPFGEFSSTLSAGNATKSHKFGLLWSQPGALPTCCQIAKKKYVRKFNNSPNVRCAFFCSTRTNPSQHQARVQTHSKEEASRWRVPPVRVQLFSRVPIPVV